MNEHDRPATNNEIEATKGLINTGAKAVRFFDPRVSDADNLALGDCQDGGGSA
jgi:hypothetical protein